MERTAASRPGPGLRKSCRPSPATSISRRGFYNRRGRGPGHHAEFDQNDRSANSSQELRLAGGRRDQVTWLVGHTTPGNRVLTYSPGFTARLFNTNVLIPPTRRPRAGRYSDSWIGADSADEAGHRPALPRRGPQLRRGTRDLNPFGFSFLCMRRRRLRARGAGQFQIAVTDTRISDKNWSGARA